ncbi:MAG: nucleotide sugar dehydrogenase [Holosporales bacterium]|nr:nucleotide sugar dehydrogenase [Holosporales bacterium]
MNIAIIGLWHLGCVYAAGSAAAGHHVVGWDNDVDVVKNLASGIPPLFEPGLAEQVSACLKNKSLTFEVDLRRAVCGAEVAWITFDTPVDEFDVADCDFVFEKVRCVLPLLEPDTTVLVSSQLPVGSVGKMKKIAVKIGREDLEFACSPENLRLGQALKVFANPDRIVCGIETEESRSVLQRLFAPITDKIEWMKIESAEMTKHAINAFLATSIVFANEIAATCEEVGADAKEVERGLKTESRIGHGAYVGPGLAFSGGTLARDIGFLSDISDKNDNNSILIKSVKTSNNKHKMWVIDKLISRLGSLKGKKIALLGLAYKPGTNTLRRSLSIECAENLLSIGACVCAHDPMISELPPEWRDRISMADSVRDALNKAHAFILCTGWDEYRAMSESDIVGVMTRPLLIDPARFLFDKFGESNTIEYIAVGFDPGKIEVRRSE